MEHDRIRQIASLKFQLRVSAVILVFYAISYLAFTEYEKANGVGVVEGDAVQSSESANQVELTWEILVVDPRLHEELWRRFREADEKERGKALFAVLIMMDSIHPEQAEHLAQGVVRYDSETTSVDHREKLHTTLEKLGTTHKGTNKSIATYALLQLRENQNFYKVEQVRRMMKRIENALKESPYRTCLNGSQGIFRECALEMVRERQQVERDILWKMATDGQVDEVRRRDARLVLARVKDPRPKAEIESMLASKSPMQIELGLALVREYRLSEYLPRIQKIRAETQFEALQRDLDATVRYLSLPNH